MPIALDPSWAVDRLGLAASLQAPETFEIHAAAVVERLAAPPAAADGP